MLAEVFSMTDDDVNEFVAEGEYEPSGANTAAIGFALLLIGFAAGAIAAALLTPKTGKQMRRQLRRKLDDARDTVGDWSDQAGGLREKAADFAGKAQEWADAAKERVGPLAKKVRG
jgi:gas vesicle protein